MAERAARLHDDLLAGTPRAEQREEMTDLDENWRHAYADIATRQAEDRLALG